MPIYNYQCNKCNHSFDTLHKADFEGPVQCEKCDCTDTSKILHAPVLVFKGSGFYINDSKRDAKNAIKKRYEGKKFTPIDD